MNFLIALIFIFVPVISILLIIYSALLLISPKRFMREENFQPKVTRIKALVIIVVCFAILTDPLNLNVFDIKPIIVDIYDFFAEYFRKDPVAGTHTET